MGNYSKLIGSVVGALAGIGAAFGLSEVLTSPEMQAALVVVATGLFTYFFPKNTQA